MDWDETLTARLLAASSVSGIVGTKVDWLPRPEADALPALVLQTISDPRPRNFDRLDALRRSVVQLNVFGRTKAEAKAAVEAAIAVLTVPIKLAFGGVFFDQV